VKFVAVINHDFVYTIDFLTVHLFSLHGTSKFHGTPYGKQSHFRFPLLGSWECARLGYFAAESDFPLLAA